MQNAVINGFKTGIRQWRVAAVVYCLQLCLALTVGMQVYEVLHASIGHSLEVNKLLANYDHTVITDFLKVHGASITPLIGQLRWLLLAWFLFSVFINGGLLYCAVHPEQASWKTFWQGGASYFFAFLKTSFFFLCLALLWIIVTLLPIGVFLQQALVELPSEKYAVWAVFASLGLCLLGISVLFIWSAISKWQQIKAGQAVWVSIKSAWRIWRNNLKRTMGMLAFFVSLQLLLLSLYWVLEALLGMRSPGLILLVFLLQQAFVFWRIQLRQILYASIGYLLKL